MQYNNLLQSSAETYYSITVLLLLIILIFLLLPYKYKSMKDCIVKSGQWCYYLIINLLSGASSVHLPSSTVIPFYVFSLLTSWLTTWSWGFLEQGCPTGSQKRVHCRALPLRAGAAAGRNHVTITWSRCPRKGQLKLERFKSTPGLSDVSLSLSRSRQKQNTACDKNVF